MSGRDRTARRLAVAAAVAGLVVVVPAPVSSATTTSPRAQDGELVVAAQDFVLALADVFDVTVSLPAGYDTATLGADGSDAELVVRSHVDARTRENVRDVLDGDLPRVVDRVDIPLDLDLADARVVRASATQLTVSVATEATETSADALRLEQWGAVPVSITLAVDGEDVARVATFVSRQAGEDEQADELAVGLVMGQTVEPNFGVDGTVTPSAHAVAELTRLADALAAIDESVQSGTVAPRAVRVEPATLTALANAEPDLTARLVPLLERGEVIAVPLVPLDPSSAVVAEKQDLYARLLRDGEDALNAIVPSARLDRTLFVVRQPISGEAVTMRRDFGTQMLIMPFAHYEALDGSIGASFTDTSQVMEVDAPDGVQVPALLVDPRFETLLDASGDAALSTAVALSAEVIALSRQIADSGGTVGRHGIVLSRRSAGVPDPELIGLVAQFLTGSAGVRLVQPSDLASIVDEQLVDGRAVTVTPLASAGVDLRARFDALDEIGRDILGTASMLPPDEPVVSAWTSVIDVAVSTSISDGEAFAMIDRLREQIDVFRNGVQGPEPYTFRITGRSGKVRFELRNLTEVTLTVRVRMSSAKLDFLDADRLVELPPLQETRVEIPFEALSNGTSSVFLRIFTPAPDPSAETQIVPDIILTARVSTLTGLGQLVTGAALLVLCTWWIRHWRQARRKRLADAVTPRHPAAASARTTETLAPDAAASTLPPP